MTGLERVVAAQVQATSAGAAAEQAIRDALAGGATPTQVVEALGTSNRQRVYAVARRAPGAPQAPERPPVVYLRAAGAPAAQWTAIVDAMHLRGWSTVRDRTVAWHLARGGEDVVLCDWTYALRDAGDSVLVGRVRATYLEQRFGDQLTQEMELPLRSGGPVGRPVGADGQTSVEGLARLVGKVLST